MARPDSGAGAGTIVENCCRGYRRSPSQVRPAQDPEPFTPAEFYGFELAQEFISGEQCAFRSCFEPFPLFWKDADVLVHSFIRRSEHRACPRFDWISCAFRNIF